MALSDASAREILREAWTRVHGRAPTSRELLYAQAIARLETGYGRAGQFGALAARGQFNWGALETRAPADGVCPAGTAPGNDQGSVCFFVFSSDVDAAAAFVRTLTKKHWPVLAAMKTGSPEDVASAMRVSPPYYTGISGSEQQKVQAYANAIASSIRAMGDPVPQRTTSPRLLPLLAGAGIAAFLFRDDIAKWWKTR